MNYTFHAQSAADLQLPLAQALASAEDKHAVLFTLVLAAGRYDGLTLRPGGADGSLDFAVEVLDGRAVFGGAVSVDGRNVTVRGLVLDGARTPGTALRLRAFERLEVEDVALIGVTVGDPAGREGDPAIELGARARGATASVRRLWVVDAATSGAVIKVPVNGPGRFTKVELTDVAFAGNRAIRGVDVAGTDALDVSGALVVEPRIKGAWLMARTAGALRLTMIVRAALAGGLALASACASAERHAGAANGGATMTAMTCDSARGAIEARRFVGWRGLPAGCRPEQLAGVAFDDDWGVRALGEARAPARMRLLDVAGYYRPLVTVRDGAVVMIDGMNPQLDGGWAALEADLGAPEASRDFVFGTTPMAGGERIYASRGITVFVNPDNQLVVHVALYAPTTVTDYLARLRPDLTKSPR